ncbi:hypothetical protein DXG03_004483 [Asterophora parasitica]|uniref:HMG box domain-containing protein n=1 Tax=Asterophora parasitica TaxID=117018 RepID=A0A9P7GEW8_9AGAR|nr:hypothetical protein DXG03_004483 [Asterophora parasitica]
MVEGEQEARLSERKFSGLSVIASLSQSPTPEEFILPNTSEPSLPSSPEPPPTSHSRRRPKGNPPRPPNAFMLFRSDFWAKEKQKDLPIERDHRDISRIAGHCWNNLGTEERAYYKALAIQRKEMHTLEHPGYKYVPSVRRDRAPKRKTRRGAEEEEERCKKLASFVMEGLSHADLREAMKATDKKSLRGMADRLSSGPSSPRRRSSRTVASRHHASPSQMAVKVEKEEPLLPIPGPSSQLFDGPAVVSVVSPEGYLLAEEVSRRGSPVVKKEDEEFAIGSYSALRPSGYDFVDPQFGVKQPAAATSNLAAESYPWYNHDAIMAGDMENTLDLDFALDHFSNPFIDCGNEDLLTSQFTPTHHQLQGAYEGSSSSAFTLAADPSSSGTYDSEMRNWLNIDF